MERKQVINLKQMLEETARRYGSKAAMVMGERHVTYAEIDQASNKVAHALLKAGMKRDDRIAMLLPNSPEFAIVYFGIIKSGAIAVPLDAKYKVEEWASLFNNCTPRMVIAESATLNTLAPLFRKFKSIKQFMELGGSGSYNLSYEEIMATGSAESTEIEPQPEDMVHIAYASGPTTRPTGVIASHRNLLKEAEITADGFQQTEKDVVMLFALPLYHHFGLVVILLTSFYKGSTVAVVPGTGLSIGTLLEAIEKERGTLLFGVPYIFALLNKIAREKGVRNDLSSLRLCGSGGAPLSTSVVRQFKKHFGFPLVDFWGLTEAMAIVTCPPLGGPIKLSSVGKPLPGWEVKIVDENGSELPTNQPGEVIVRGPITEGYYHNPQATAGKIKNGWLYTGDMGRVDKDGYLFLTGLKKRMIILKGKKIYPIDIEEVLATYPKIAAARAIAIPDRLRGEMVGAVILLKERVEATAQEIKRFCQEHMSDYKLPRQVIFTTQSSLANLSKIANIRLSQRKLKELLSSLSNLPSPLKYKKKPSKAQ